MSNGIQYTSLFTDRKQGESYIQRAGMPGLSLIHVPDAATMLSMIQTARLRFPLCFNPPLPGEPGHIALVDLNELIDQLRAATRKTGGKN